jgi:hypothetical protein
MNFGVFVLGLEQSELDKCGAVERSLYHFIGLGFWMFMVLASVSGGVNLYYVDDHFFSIAIGAILFPVLLGSLFRILLISVKRPPRFFDQKWYKRYRPDLGTFVRFTIIMLLTLIIAMPLSGVLQYHRVERVAAEKREELRLNTLDASGQSSASSISKNLEKNEHNHYPVAIYYDLLTTGLTKAIIILVFLILVTPVGFLLLLKFVPRFQYQEQINSKIENEARANYEKCQLLALEQLKKFGTTSEFPQFTEYEDYPINSIKRKAQITTVKNDQELLKLLWIPKK